MPLLPDGNESSFLFWGLKIIIFMWFECFILSATRHTIKTTSFLVVISPLATMWKRYCIKINIRMLTTFFEMKSLLRYLLLLFAKINISKIIHQVDLNLGI